MVERAEYLTKVIDSVKGKATGSEIEELPRGKIVVNWSCSSGKTTAIRQFLCDHPMSYNLLAVPTIKDVESIYYDIKSVQLISPKMQLMRIAKFYSGLDLSTEELQSSNLIICTHERLMIECPKLLYRVKDQALDESLKVPGVDLCFRDNVMIDEMPNFYKKLRITPELMTSLGVIVRDSQTLFNDETQAQLYRLKFTHAMITKYLYDEGTLQVPISKADLFICESVIKVLNSMNVHINPDEREYAISKFTFFSTFIMNELVKLQNTEIELSDAKIYYSLSSLGVPNIQVFDGTGDLILRDSPIWSKLSDNKYPRTLKLNQLPTKLSGTTVSRRLSSEYDVNTIKFELTKFTEAIKSILSKTKGNLLVYTWKNIKLIDDSIKATSNNPEVSLVYQSVIDSLPKYLQDHLPESEYHRLRFIYYKSGEDRVTSQYSDCDTILILGKFFIPPSTISEYNKVNQTNISTEDYTISLLIQAIYRTQARVGKSVDMYYTDDYSDLLFAKLLNCIDVLSINDKLINTGKKSLIHELYKISTDRNSKYIQFILTHISELDTESVLELTTPDSERSDKFKSGIQLVCSKLTQLEYINISNTRSFQLKLHM